MMRSLKLTPRQILIVLHDLLATAAAIVVTFFMRFEGAALNERLHALVLFLPCFLVYALIVYFVVGLQRNKWRFTSVPDLYNLFRASTVLAVSLLALDYVLISPNFYGTFFFGKITILLYWFLQMFFLGGLRVVYRYLHYRRTLKRVRIADATPTLVLGRAADAEVLLRGIESGAVKKIWPVGVLSPSTADRGQSIRGIPVLGDIDDLERIVADLEASGDRVMRLVLAPSALDPEARPEAILMRARRLGLSISQLPSLDADGPAVQLAPVAVEDLLLRPSVKIDYRRLEDFVSGRAIVVTGGGGSIGAEICDRIVTFGAARLLVIEHSEPALHAVLETLKGKQSYAAISGRIADIRDRDRIMGLVAQFKPDIVFHAAALKHVPMLEQDWDEGIKTNVFGSINVADAAAAAGATAMVMISTDKAIEPVSVLGATKRLAEMYCQALDDEFARRSTPGQHAMRLISVRFGNVLASNGSVVPKFKAQIEAGGPVTVTHPDMVRYFMTIREACDLVITSASHALEDRNGDVSVYVLNMGQPVKIVDLAERIIRLSGLEPGRDIKITFT
ncbi:MAG: nucleoside-diphosphate sugar epimerase/dehydratase, partial [Pseudolabrys sp.]